MTNVYLILLVVSSSFLSGCTGIKLDASNANIVMAKSATREKGATQITDSFTFEGKVYAYVALTWDPEKTGGQQEIEARWYNGDRLRSRRTHTATLNKSPHYVWFDTSGAALGTGNCRVEIYARDILLGTKSFTVKEK